MTTYKVIPMRQGDLVALVCDYGDGLEIVIASAITNDEASDIMCDIMAKLSCELV